MGYVLLLGILFVLIVVLAKRAGGPARLASKGLKGRALVISANQMSSGVRVNGVRYEQRWMTLDVEVEGRASYQTTGTYLVPRGVCETTPGSSLDVSVDPRNQSNLVILGPGGFTGPWIRQGPPSPY